MKLGSLITYSFDPNVGPIDRMFRILSGGALAVVPWTVVSVPLWFTVVMTVFGLAWLLTGLVSRCGMYYLFGLSTKS